MLTVCDVILLGRFSMQICLKGVVLAVSLVAMSFAKSYGSGGDMGKCYALNWMNRSLMDKIDADYYPEANSIWNCQAKGKQEASYTDTNLSTWSEDWRSAVDRVLFRCERLYSECSIRCALAPKICYPHYWP